MASEVRILPSPPYFEHAGIAQLARASAFQAEGCGFDPRFPLHAHVAQVAEHFLGKEGVMSSSLIVGSIIPFEGEEQEDIWRKRNLIGLSRM